MPMNNYDCYPGQVLLLDAPKAGTCLVKVTKVNQKNVKVIKEDGQVWNVSPFYLSPVPEDKAAEFTPTTSGAARLTTGMVVQFVSLRMPRDLFVVIGERAGTFRLTKLGGDNGRYYPSITPEQVEVVDFAVSGA
jgi:hypothetical protein